MNASQKAAFGVLFEIVDRFKLLDKFAAIGDAGHPMGVTLKEHGRTLCLWITGLAHDVLPASAIGLTHVQLTERVNDLAVLCYGALNKIDILRRGLTDQGGPVAIVLPDLDANVTWESLLGCIQKYTDAIARESLALVPPKPGGNPVP